MNVFMYILSPFPTVCDFNKAAYRITSLSSLTKIIQYSAIARII